MTTPSQKSRRQFLQGIAAAGTASILLPSADRAFGYQSANERPVFATIGLRNQGWAITSKSFGFADFAALADVDANVLGDNVEKVEKGRGKKPDAYKDYRKILDRKDIDAVMIATPDHWHTKIAVEAMHAGKDVYCEKPLTLTIAEGKLIEKVVKQTGRVFQVGTMQRTEIDQRFPAGDRAHQRRPHRQGQEGDLRHRPTWNPRRSFRRSPVPKGSIGTSGLGRRPRFRIAHVPEMRQGYGGGVPLYSNCHISSASSSLLKVVTETTGPKISSWNMRILLWPSNTVGWT